jgi:hypothetical protein
MRLLEEAGCDERGLVGLGSVNGVVLRLELTPFCMKTSGEALYIIAPVLDVLNDNFIGSMHRKGAWGIRREGVCDTPRVNDIRLAF